MLVPQSNHSHSDSFADASQLPDGALYPPTPQGQAAYFEALRSVLLQVPNDNLTMFDFTGAALPSRSPR